MISDMVKYFSSHPTYLFLLIVFSLLLLITISSFVEGNVKKGVANVIVAILISVVTGLFGLLDGDGISISCKSCRMISDDSYEVEFNVNNPNREEVIESGCRYFSDQYGDNLVPYGATCSEEYTIEESFIISGVISLREDREYMCRGYVITKDGKEYYTDSKKLKLK